MHGIGAGHSLAVATRRREQQELCRGHMAGPREKAGTTY